jgi:hypothetical protein
MDRSSVPLGTQAGLSIKDRSPDSRRPPATLIAGPAITFPELHSSGRAHFAQQRSIALAGFSLALTVAGQWRIFTAFPSILTIVVVTFAPEIERSRLS